MPTVLNRFNKQKSICINFAFALCFSFHYSSHAQILQTEAFDMPGSFPSTNFPAGWKQTTIQPNQFNYWDRNGLNVLPNCAPHSGIGMLRYRSYNAPSGISAYVVSRPFNLEGRGSADSQFWFWMFRDNFYPFFIDNIEVFINTSDTIAGATLLADNVNGLTTIHRWCGNQPMVTCSTLPTYDSTSWKMYNYTIPAGSNWNNDSVYVIIKGNSDFGYDIHLDDFSIETFPAGTGVLNYDGDIENNLNLIYNPTNQVLNISAALKNPGRYQLLIYDALGNIVSNKSKFSGGRLVAESINCLSLLSGVYSVCIFAESEKYLAKFVKL